MGKKGIIIAGIIVVAVIAIVITILLLKKKSDGDGGDKCYKVNCQCFEGVKSSYMPGEKVEIYYTLIATDTDYSFYIDGESYNAYWDEKKYGYKISFIMPAHDVEVSCKSRNTMVYVPDDTENDT